LQAALGGSHTLLINHDNDVYGFGGNSHGQLGLSTIEFEAFHQPKKLVMFEEKCVTAISAGSNHSAALMIEGYAYSWG